MHVCARLRRHLGSKWIMHHTLELYIKFYSGVRFGPQDTVMDHKIYIVFPWQTGFSCLSLYAYCFRAAPNNKSLHVCKAEVSTSAGEKCGVFSLQSGTSSTSSCLMRQWTQTSVCTCVCVCEEKNWKLSEEIRWSEDIYLLSSLSVLLFYPPS